MVCALDNQTEGTMSALASRDVAAAAVAESARKGYLDGQALAGVFTWLRPNDLVWNYVVNNYLLGKPPPAFDILYWNQDTVRLAAGLHRDFIHIGLDNSFTRPGSSRCSASPSTSAPSISTPISSLGSAITSSPGRAPTKGRGYSGATAGSCSREAVTSRRSSTRRARNPARAIRVADDVSAEPDDFLVQAPQLPGSWWPDWDAWLAERAGELKRAPKTLGNRKHKAQAKAPGTYVLAR